MGYLRLAQPVTLGPTDNRCIDVFDRELDYLFENLRRLGAAPREIEDLAQDVFVVLHRNWPTLDLSRSLRPYLFGIAFRVVCANRRRRAREIPYPSLDAADSGTSPEGLLESKESVSLLMAALNRVPLPRRAVLVMHDLDGVPIGEIARNLSITRFGTYARLRKARIELARAVERLLKTPGAK